MKETDKIYPADKGEEELLHNVRHICLLYTSDAADEL